MTKPKSAFAQVDPNNHTRKECKNNYCRIHRYYAFDAGFHVPLPNTWNYLSSRFGWVRQIVHVGPPGYYPPKPKADEWQSMQRHCPHTQMDLTCNTCLRHTFRPLEIEKK